MKKHLLKRDVYWIYRLKTLQPIGFNEITEVVIT